MNKTNNKTIMNKPTLIRSYEKYISSLNESEQQIVDDILATNESADTWWNKFLEYGKKGVLTAAIILSVAMSAQAQTAGKIDQTIKMGIELTQDQNIKKDVYSFFIGMATENASISMKSGDIDAAGAFKEISKYYQDLRDDKTPTPLSTDTQKYVKIMKNIHIQLDQKTIEHFIQSGKTIKTRA